MNKNKVQAPVVRTLDSATQRIINYVFHWIEIYRVDTGVIYLLNSRGQVCKMHKIVRCA